MKTSEFMERCSSTRPAVVVSRGGGVALGIVRDLGREGVPIVSAGPSARDAGLRSRYSVAADGVQGYDGRFLEDLMALGAKIRPKAVLFVAEDEQTFAVSRNKTSLEEQFIVPILGWDRMRRLADKEQQVRVARQAGVSVPATAVIRSPKDLKEAADVVPFPAVLKPNEGHSLEMRTGTKVIRVDGGRELAEAYERIRFCDSSVLQEIVPGPDHDVLLCGTYHDAGSRPLAVFTGRKLRQLPRGFGNTRAGESLWSDELAQEALKFLAAVPYHGLSDVEFKRDSRDGRLKFMEVNPRQGLWSPLARAAGVNLAYIAYRDAVGKPCPTVRQTDGVRWTNLLRDVPHSLIELRRGDLRPAEWLGTLRGLRVDCFLSARDPMPGLVEGRSIAVNRLPRRLKKALHLRD